MHPASETEPSLWNTSACILLVSSLNTQWLTCIHQWPCSNCDCLLKLSVYLSKLLAMPPAQLSTHPHTHPPSHPTITHLARHFYQCLLVLQLSLGSENSMHFFFHFLHTDLGFVSLEGSTVVEHVINHQQWHQTVHHAWLIN